MSAYKDYEHDAAIERIRSYYRTEQDPPREGFNHIAFPGCCIPEGEALETFEDVFSWLAAEALDLLIKKQRAYGSENIRQLGFYGVLDRLASDKVERIRNSLEGEVVRGRVVTRFTEKMPDESIEDAIFDLINYGLILLALKRGLWGLPLREEVAS